jgi:hypothetical protein
MAVRRHTEKTIEATLRTLYVNTLIQNVMMGVLAALILIFIILYSIDLV